MTLCRDPYVTKYKRDVAMTWITWIANTGGLMGLCMGMSFVSIAEIIYYCCKTLGRCCGLGREEPEGKVEVTGSQSAKVLSWSGFGVFMRMHICSPPLLVIQSVAIISS